MDIMRIINNIKEEKKKRDLSKQNNPNVIYKKENIDYLDGMLDRGWLNKEMYEDALLKIGNPKHIYNYAIKNSDSVLKMSRGILKSNNAFYMLEYYLKFSSFGLDIRNYAKAIAQTKDLKYIVLFMNFINNKEDLDIIIDNIVNTADTDLMYNVALTFQNNKNVSVDKLILGIIKCGDENDIIKVAKNILDAPLDELTYGIALTKESKKIIEFSEILRGKNYLNEKALDMLISGIKMSGDNDDICYFASRYSNFLTEDQINVLAQTIIDTNKGAYIHFFAIDVTNAPMDLLIDAILNTDDAKYIYKFAFDVPNVPVELFATKIAQLGNAEYIYYFAKYIKDAPIDILTEGIVQTDDLEYLNNFLCEINNKAEVKQAIKKLEKKVK